MDDKPIGRDKPTGVSFTLRDKPIGIGLTLRDKIKEIIAQAVGTEASDIEEAASLRADLGLAEADITELVEAIQQEVNTTIPADEAADTKTVREFADLAEKYSQDEL